MELEYDKIFSGHQPRQVALKKRCFESRLGPHYQGTDMSTEPRMFHISPGRYIYIYIYIYIGHPGLRRHVP
jgi:hypothetical protein